MAEDLAARLGRLSLTSEVGSDDGADGTTTPPSRWELAGMDDILQALREVRWVVERGDVMPDSEGRLGPSRCTLLAGPRNKRPLEAPHRAVFSTKYFLNTIIIYAALRSTSYT